MNQNNQQPNALLKTRGSDRLKNLVTSTGTEVCVLKASADWGTVLNNGRRGSLFAPNVLESLLLKMAGHATKNNSLEFFEVSNFKSEEQIDLKVSQLNESQKIAQHLKNLSQKKYLLHIGGGHDHFYPLLLAYLSIPQTSKKVLILNIDPHLDTRTDSWSNSGTPFRNLDQALCSANPHNHQMTLVQLGTHLFANGEANYSPLKNMKQEIYEMSSIRKDGHLKNFVHTHLSAYLQSHDEIVLSFDVDAIKASEMPAVSAPNHLGFSMEEMHELIEYLKMSAQEKFKIAGFYEYNPMFDDLAGSSGRALAALIYQQFLIKKV